MNQQKNHKRNILLSPLNWGLGHATRLLPVIDALLHDGHTCIIAGESPSLDIIKKEFPNLTYIETNGFTAQLSSGKNQLLKLFTQLPAFIYSLIQDKKTVRGILARFPVNLIISDNRYGFRDNGVPSVIITHQTSPPTGKILFFIRPLVNIIAGWWIKRFTACWIPDINKNFSISGRLSDRKSHKNTSYTGLLSRLSLLDKKSLSVSSDKADVLVILSGPEPQRSEFEKQLINRYRHINFKVIILRGLPRQNETIQHIGSITLLPHCDAATYYRLLTTSGQIICRSGYSTLMDLFYVNRKATLVPTPGQYEQEYLARHLQKHFGFKTLKQSRIKNNKTIAFIPSYDKACHQNYSKDFKLPSLPACK